MNKEELWKKFCEINPNFLGEENICLNPAKIKKLVETSFKYGSEFGFKNGQEWERNQSKMKSSQSAPYGLDFFNEIFNKK
jgi:hypothetical protein